MSVLYNLFTPQEVLTWEICATVAVSIFFISVAVCFCVWRRGVAQLNEQRMLQEFELQKLKLEMQIKEDTWKHEEAVRNAQWNREDQLRSLANEPNAVPDK